jgi:hypothetical protein
MAGIDPPAGINEWELALGGRFGTLPSGRDAGSMHPGGCFFAMGDGSVHWVGEDTSAVVLFNLSAIADGTAPEIE